MVAIDIDMSGADKAGAGNEFMSDFFEEVGHIKSLMSQIRTNIKSIQDTYAKQNWTDSAQPGQRTFSAFVSSLEIFFVLKILFFPLHFDGISSSLNSSWRRLGGASSIDQPRGHKSQKQASRDEDGERQVPTRQVS